MLRRYGMLICILLGIAACTTPETRLDTGANPSASAQSVRIVAWNPEFLWDGLEQEDGSSEVEFAWKGNPEIAARRIAEVAEIFGGLDPDIAVLSEIEGGHILDRLAATPGPSGRELTPVFVQGKDSFTGQDVGMLAWMKPVLAYRSDERVALNSQNPAQNPAQTQGVSKNLIARLPFADGRCLSVIAIHLLARPEDVSRAPAREAQAEVVRQAALNERRTGCGVVVAGDFNDYDPDVATPAGHKAVTRVLEIVKSMDPADKGDDLVNPAIRLPPAERYSNRWDRDGDGQIDLPRDGSLIDHVLVSPSLQVPDVTIVRPLVGQEPLSDHDPVVVTIAWPAMTGM